MNRVISWFQTSLLRQVLTVFIVGFVFFAAPVFNSNTLVARAENTVKSPEGVYYKGTPDDSIHNGANGQTNKNRSVFDASDATKVQNGEKSLNSSTQNSSSSGTVTTPEGAYYKATPDDSIHNRINEQNKNRSVFDASDATKNQGGEKSGNPFKEAVDTVREKLNLDEELPRSTKEFLKETEERVEETVEPVTGTRKGYYQIP